MSDTYEVQNDKGRWRIWDREWQLLVTSDSGKLVQFVHETHARDYAAMMSEARRRRLDLEKRAVFAGIEKEKA